MTQNHPFSVEIPKSSALDHLRDIAAVTVLILALLSAAIWWYLFPFRKSHELLHVSFDGARHAFPPIDQSFEDHMLADQGQECFISTHFAGSIQQANGVASGLIADVASFASPMEVFQIQQKGDTVATDWASLYPHGSSPFYSTMVWVVKPGVELSSRAWSSLLDPSVHPCMPDPNYSGAGRYAYFAVLAGFSGKEISSPAGSFRLADMLLLKTDIEGDRASMTSRHFLKTPSLNLLITWESEALRLVREQTTADLKVLYPEVSIQCEPVVVELTDHSLQRSTSDRVHRYINSLYSDTAQHAFARAGFRPRNTAILEQYRKQFPPCDLSALPDLMGSWDTMLEEAFGKNGHFSWIQQVRIARMGGSE